MKREAAVFVDITAAQTAVILGTIEKQRTDSIFFVKRFWNINAQIALFSGKIKLDEAILAVGFAEKRTRTAE